MTTCGHVWPSGPLSWLLSAKLGMIPCREKLKGRPMSVDGPWEIGECPPPLTSLQADCPGERAATSDLLQKEIILQLLIQGQDQFPSLKNSHLYWGFIIDSHEPVKNVAGDWESVNSNWEYHRT